MDRKTVTRRTCGIGVLVLLAGCGPTVIAYPPPAALPGAVEPLDPRQIGVTLGPSAFLYADSNGPALMSDQLGGLLVGSFGVGIADGLDVAVTGSQTLQGPTGSVDVGMRIRETPAFYLGAVGGLAGSTARDTYTVEVPTDPDDPDAKVEHTSLPYSYATLAPHLGVRAVWQKYEQVHIPLLLRGSYSFAFAQEGLDDGYDMPHYAWVELSSGVVYAPARVFAVGLGTGVRFNTGPTGWLTPNVLFSTSVTFRFDVPKPDQKGL
jgi:hypothetical protein